MTFLPSPLTMAVTARKRAHVAYGRAPQRRPAARPWAASTHVTLLPAVGLKQGMIRQILKCAMPCSMTQRILLTCLLNLLC